MLSKRNYRPQLFLILLLLNWLEPSVSSNIDMQHKEWVSSIYYDELDNFTASTDHSGVHGDITLFLGRTAEDCDEWDVSLTFEGNSLAPKAFESELMRGQLRVDAKAIHSVDYQVSFEEDESHLFIGLEEPDDKDVILYEIQQGERLRIKLTVNKRDYVLGFSLSGAGEAIDRAKLLCARHVPDKEYFGIDSVHEDDQYEL